MKPRLHVLLARDAPTAVVIRRGPSRSVAAIGWDRRRDRFELGQWLRGRIYERRCDVSPDGKHMIYFAMNGHWSSETGGSWTAVSQAPYLRALVLLGKGDCWNGGGLFVDNRTYWVNDGYGHKVMEDTTALTRAPRDAYRVRWGGECWGVYFLRLERDGWRLRLDLSLTAEHNETIVWEKPLPRGWTLRKLASAGYPRPQGQSIYHDEHELVAPDGRELSRETWEWADLDGKRLVWGEAGALWTGEPEGEPRMLHDFSAMTFEAIEAPYARAKSMKPRSGAVSTRRTRT